MTVLSQLWTPILLSAVLIFFASFIIHMVSGWHKGDYLRAEREDDLMAAVRGLGMPPGDYMVPRPNTREDMNTPAFKAKVEQGPAMVLTIMAPGGVKLGKALGSWFVYIVVVNIFAGYVGSRALAPGAEYLSVFRFVGTTAFAAYSLALFQMSIWYQRSWGTTIRSSIDGLVYAMLTAGVFGWLWP